MSVPPGTVRLIERLLWIAAAAALLIVVFRTAWMSDDAYITLRTIDNWKAGYGLRWNVDERVAAFTHPLWLLAEAAAWTITGEHYFSTLILSIACAMTGVLLLTARAQTISTPACFRLISGGSTRSIPFWAIRRIPSGSIAIRTQRTTRSHSRIRAVWPLSR